jgi:hypothetical protein
MTVFDLKSVLSKYCYLCSLLLSISIEYLFLFLYFHFVCVLKRYSAEMNLKSRSEGTVWILVPLSRPCDREGLDLAAVGGQTNIEIHMASLIWETAGKLGAHSILSFPLHKFKVEVI